MAHMIQENVLSVIGCFSCCFCDLKRFLSLTLFGNVSNQSFKKAKGSALIKHRPCLIPKTAIFPCRFREFVSQSQCPLLLDTSAEFSPKEDSILKIYVVVKA